MKYLFAALAVVSLLYAVVAGVCCFYPSTPERDGGHLYYLPVEPNETDAVALWSGVPWHTWFYRSEADFSDN